MWKSFLDTTPLSATHTCTNSRLCTSETKTVVGSFCSHACSLSPWHQVQWCLARAVIQEDYCKCDGATEHAAHSGKDRAKESLHLGVPVGVEEDAGVGGLQVDTQAARLCVEDVDEQVGAGRVEAVDVYHALHARRAAVQPHIPGQQTGLHFAAIKNRGSA